MFLFFFQGWKQERAAILDYSVKILDSGAR